MACAPASRRGPLSRALLVAAVLAMAAGACTMTASAAAIPDDHAAVGLADRGWEWPVAAFRLERAYEAPAHRYGAGHRGIDLRPLERQDVRAPAPGSIAFSGMVAGRGILTSPALLVGTDHRLGAAGPLLDDAVACVESGVVRRDQS